MYLSMAMHLTHGLQDAKRTECTRSEQPTGLDHSSQAPSHATVYFPSACFGSCTEMEIMCAMRQWLASDITAQVITPFLRCGHACGVWDSRPAAELLPHNQNVCDSVMHVLHACDSVRGN